MATSVAFIDLFLIDACMMQTMQHANYACCTVSELNKTISSLKTRKYMKKANTIENKLHKGHNST